MTRSPALKGAPGYYLWVIWPAGVLLSPREHVFYWQPPYGVAVCDGKTDDGI